MNEKQEKVLNIVEQLKSLVPVGYRIDIDRVTNTKPGDYTSKPGIYIFDCPSYDEGTEILRSFGFKDRKKEPHTSGHCNLTGEDEHMSVTVFCATLPPTCRLVKTKKLVPKKEVRTVESNEMVEVEITEVVCDGGPEQAKLDATRL